MSTNQIVGILLVVAGCTDLVAIPLLRSRIPGERARTLTLALVTSAAAMIGLGILFLVR